MIPFNKPHSTGKELEYIQQAILTGKTAGDGPFTEKCHQFFKNRFGFKNVLLTTSCTHALEMTALLIDTQPGDEVIMASYTFVSTANAFALRGAKIVFVDSRKDHPGMDEDKIEAAITQKTKAIVAMHYAGIACDMDKIMKVAKKHGLFVIEDAAQAIGSRYRKKPLGSLGHFATFSFHATKNISSGEGGLLVVNDDRFIDRAEIIRENGTDRSQFLRGETKEYTWKDVGSSYSLSEINAAFLFAQLKEIEEIQTRRKEIWTIYNENFKGFPVETKVKLPFLPSYSTHNAHMYYLVCSNPSERKKLMAHLKAENIQAVFHYLALHRSDFYSAENQIPQLKNCDHYAMCLLRLPFYYSLKKEEQNKVIASVLRFYEAQEEK